MKIRDAKSSDIEFLKQGLRNVRMIEKRPEKDIPVTEDDVNSFKQGIQERTIRVIDDELGIPAAFLYWRTDFRIPYVHGKYLWIDILYVREDKRVTGLGTALYDDAIKVAHQLGLDRIVIDIFDPNERSKKFHSDLDFKPFYTIYTKKV